MKQLEQPRVGMYFAFFTEGCDFVWDINRVSKIAETGIAITVTNEDGGDGAPYDWHMTMQDWLTWQCSKRIIVLPSALA